MIGQNQSLSAEDTGTLGEADRSFRSGDVESDAIPPIVASYLAQVSPDSSTIHIADHGAPILAGQYRAIEGVVFAGGWSGFESWGVWSEGSRAILYLKNVVEAWKRIATPEIAISARGAVSDVSPKLATHFTIGSARTEHVFSWPNGRSAVIRIQIPPEFRNASVLRLQIGIDSPKTPYEHTRGASTDHRRVGIGLTSIQLGFPGPTVRLHSDKGLSSEPTNVTTARRMVAAREAIRPFQGYANVIAMTMVYNEGSTLRRWLKHYGQHLGARNLLVIDDGSDDGSTDDIGLAGRLTIPRKPFDDGERADFVSDLQRDLLRYFDAVIYTDCDEFLVPDPRRFCSLREYVDKMKSDCVRPVAFNLIHIRDQEPALDPDRLILDQRTYCRFYTPECKPALTRVPVRYEAGFHSCDRRALLDPELLLVHSKLADISAALARLSLTRGMAWSERAIRAGWGNHHRGSDCELMGSFDTAERLIRGGAIADTLNPTQLAARTNTEMELSRPPYRCIPFTGPLSRVPEWLRGTV